MGDDKRTLRRDVEIITHSLIISALFYIAFGLETIGMEILRGIKQWTDPSSWVGAGPWPTLRHLRIRYCHDLPAGDEPGLSGRARTRMPWADCVRR